MSNESDVLVEGYRFYSDQYIKVINHSDNFITIRSDFVNADLHELLFQRGYIYVGPFREVDKHYVELTYQKIQKG